MKIGFGQDYYAKKGLLRINNLYDSKEFSFESIDIYSGSKTESLPRIHGDNVDVDAEQFRVLSPIFNTQGEFTGNFLGRGLWYSYSYIKTGKFEQHYLYYKLSLDENNQWKKSAIGIEGNTKIYDYIYIDDYFMNSLRQGKYNFEGIRAIGSVLYEGNLYFFLEDNGTVMGRTFETTFGLDFGKYKLAHDYYNYVIGSYLQKDGKLHLFSFLPNCNDIQGEYIKGRGYKLHGHMNGKIVHFVVDLKAEDYLKPVFEKELSRFEF